ncbi:MAG: hypothetical protein HOG70_01815 [Elusimicrobiaceae bacterium]|jgi:hypothetical protein|nr:hypothetical protein [Elusimicrobiaceae bacterium]
MKKIYLLISILVLLILCQSNIYSEQGDYSRFNLKERDERRFDIYLDGNFITINNKKIKVYENGPIYFNGTDISLLDYFPRSINETKKGQKVKEVDGTLKKYKNFGISIYLEKSAKAGSTGLVPVHIYKYGHEFNKNYLLLKTSTSYVELNPFINSISRCSYFKKANMEWVAEKLKSSPSENPNIQNLTNTFNNKCAKDVDYLELLVYDLDSCYGHFATSSKPYCMDRFIKPNITLEKILENPFEENMTFKRKHDEPDNKQYKKNVIKYIFQKGKTQSLLDSKHIEALKKVKDKNGNNIAYYSWSAENLEILYNYDKDFVLESNIIDRLFSDEALARSKQIKNVNVFSSHDISNKEFKEEDMRGFLIKNNIRPRPSSKSSNFNSILIKNQKLFLYVIIIMSFAVIIFIRRKNKLSHILLGVSNLVLICVILAISMGQLKTFPPIFFIFQAILATVLCAITYKFIGKKKYITTILLLEILAVIIITTILAIIAISAFIEAVR